MKSSGYSRLLKRLEPFNGVSQVAAFHVSLREFQVINRLASPFIGDRVLDSVDRMMRQWVGDAGVSARIWSDEFVAVRAIDHPQEAGELAMDLRRNLTTIRYQGRAGEGQLAVVIGVVCGRPTHDWQLLMERAAEASLTAKERGRNQISVYGSGTSSRKAALAGPEIAAEFRRLRDAGHLSLHPQPIIDISGAAPRIAKAEFLLRIDRDGASWPPPARMIEALESHGAATDLDAFSSGFLLDWLADHPEELMHLDGVSMNLSAKSLADGAFMGSLFDNVRHARLPATKLCFEITETAAVEHLDIAAEIIRDFKTLGCRFALDDFGSGLCSFGYLQELMVDEVKIDGRFIRELADNPVTERIVRAIHQVARATNKTTVAEFVDDTRKLEVLRDIGVDYAQGWLFYPTVAPETFLDLLRKTPGRAVA